MKDEVFYGKGIHELEGEYPDLYELVKNITTDMHLIIRLKN